MQLLFFFVLTIVLALLNIIFTKKPRTAKNVLEIVLYYWLVVMVGVGGMLAFCGHAFMADKVAVSIGWQPGSPFQFEVAVANLAFGVLGILCIWLRGNFWVAAAIGQSVFAFGAAYGHIRDAMLKGNFAINNVGPVLVLGDVILPATLLVLIFIYGRMKAAAK
ncbi:MAG TPA: DUF6790 family protein [Candidatus Omnitrophota bacterium]|nr:DUF6790 family protein [Candidatus Omnitrophota bacterium]